LTEAKILLTEASFLLEAGRFFRSGCCLREG
jgi:hypothetical protein